MSNFVWRWSVVADLVRPLDPMLGAEVGVKEGRFITYLLRTFPGLRMYAVDPWIEQPDGNETYQGWDFEYIYSTYRRSTKPYYDRILELREFSTDAAGMVPDGRLDFAFVDAQHDYHSVRADVEHWQPKIRPGGILCGHDYAPGRFDGVVDAIHDLYGDAFEVAENDVWFFRC